MNKSNHNRQDNIKHRTHRIKEHIKRGHGKPMCPSFMLSCPVGLRSTIPCVICFFLPCPLVMCSCIICVLSYFIFLVHSDWFFSFDVSYNFMSTPKVFFSSCVSYVLFFLVPWDCSLPSDVSYALYCHVHPGCVFVYHMCPMSFGLLFPILCVMRFILSFPPVMCFCFILCVLCFILSWRFGLLFTIRFVIGSMLSCPSVMSYIIFPVLT
jgi:hypothetical protein